MIYLNYSNHLEALVAPLAKALDRDDPFRPIQIVVPNHNLKQWLNLYLADRLGIAANIRYGYLTPVLKELIAGKHFELPTEPFLQMMILRLLEGYRDGAEAALRAPREYLRGEGDPERKLFQLARRLNAVFREYGLSRHAMTQAWEAGRPFLSADHETESWQRRLWCDLFGRGGLLEERNRQHPDLAILPLDRLPIVADRLNFQSVHIFALSYMSRFHQELLHRLGNYGDIHLYSLNPSRAIVLVPERGDLFSGDRREAEPSLGAVEALAADPDPGENPFLRAWGRPGREFFKMLGALGPVQCSGFFVESPTTAKSTLLAQIQAGIRQGLGHRTENDQRDQDDSLRVLGCPSPRREAEIVASCIWDLLLAKSAADLRDIAVIVTDMSAYQSEVEHAFSRLYHLPYNLVDGKGGGASRLLDAVRLLLTLPASHFERESLFKFLQHPNVLARFPRIDPTTWVQYAGDLGIFFGRDREDLRGSGAAYFGEDLFNWDQGFKRLLLGAYLPAGQDTVFQDGPDAYLPLTMTESEAADARFFFTLVSSLIADTAAMAEARLSAGLWARYLHQMILTYLAPNTHEESDFEKVTRAALGIEDLGKACEHPDSPLSFDLVREFFEQDLDRLKPFFGQYLADGITVSSFLPMRPIPFKVVFVLGLDEDRFPAQIRRDTLDLRWAPQREKVGPTTAEPRELGDVTEQERDRYMFLETLISTREQLILSYVDRDEKTGDPRNPSSVLAELLFQVREICPDFQIQSHPLKGYSDGYGFPGCGQNAELLSHDPFARRLAAARQNGRAWRNLLASSGEDAKRESLSRLAPQAREYFGLVPMTIEADDGSLPVLRLSLDQIRGFLECPLQASAKRLMGRRDDEGIELWGSSHEPFYLERFLKYRILDEAMSALLAEQSGNLGDPERLAAMLDKGALRAHWAGQFPAGQLFQASRTGMLEVMHRWVEGLSTLQAGGLVVPASRVLVGAERGEGGPSPTQPLEFEIDGAMGKRKVQIYGQTQFIFNGQSNPWSIYFSTSNKSNSPKKMLRGFVDALVLSLTGKCREVTATWVPGDGGTVTPSRFSIEPESALAYLRDIAVDIDSGGNRYLLPVEAVLDQKERVKEAGFAEHFRKYIAARVDAPNWLCASRYGPVLDWRDCPPPEDPAGLIARRFGLFFASLKVPGWERGGEPK